jgi:HEAT repeat protein
VSQILEPALSEALNPDGDGEAYWVAVKEVQQRDPAQVWAALAPLVTSPDPVVRVLVPDVLRHLGGQPQPLLEQTVVLLRQLLATEQDIGVLGAIATAFIELRHPAAVELLLPLTRHAEAEVRFYAIQGLLQAIDQVMDRFIELTSDPEPEVRNWTLFALSTMLEARPQHANALREVFARALNDPHAEAKAEAALGLARCLDSTGAPLTPSASGCAASRRSIPTRRLLRS